MTKQQAIDKMIDIFGSVNNFFRWCGYKNPAQSAYSFRKEKKVSNSLSKFLDCADSIKKGDFKKIVETRDEILKFKK